MSLFDTLVVQPIFNVIMALYGLIPGKDFGVALIVFAVLVRIVMLPLIKKQLHQTKIMRQIQPELAKIKAKAKGNKQLEGQMMLELYRERGVNPFGALTVLLIQMPIFIALYQVIKIVTVQRDEIGKFIYGFVGDIPAVDEVLRNVSMFNEKLFGLVDLTAHAVGSNGQIYWPLLVLAAVSAALQYVQTKQVTPQSTSGKKLRDLMKSQAKGEKVDQSEITTVMSQRMLMIMPAIAFAVALYLPGALVLFYAASSAVAVWQQRGILAEDVDEMEEIVDDKPKKPKTTSAKKTASERAKKAEPAKTVPAKKRKKRR